MCGFDLGIVLLCQTNVPAVKDALVRFVNSVLPSSFGVLDKLCFVTVDFPCSFGPENSFTDTTLAAALNA